jgi:O-antigen/teichoic acid export membrane protein
MIRRQLLTGTVSNAAGKATAVGIWFVLTPFLLSRLGTAEYALWVLAGSLASYGLLLDFGLASAVAKYVAEHSARGDRQGASVLVASALSLYTAFALVAIALGWVLAPFVPRLLSMSPEHASTAVLLTMLTATNVGVAIAASTPAAVLRGLQRFDLYNAVSIGNSLLEAMGTVVVVLAGGGVVGIIAVFIPINLITGLLNAWLVKRTAPDLRLGWRGANLATLRQVTRFSSTVFAIETAGRLQTRTDEFVIAMFRPLTAVTAYALARKLGELAQLVALPFLKVVMPIASALNAVDQMGRLRTLYVVASRVALVIAVPIALVLVMRGEEILTLWVGAGFAPHATLLALLATATLLTTSQWPAVEILQGMGRHAFVAKVALASGIANVALSIALLGPLGLTGVALGTLIPAAVTSFAFVLPFVVRSLRLDWATIAGHIWLPALVPGGFAGAALWLMDRPEAVPSVRTLIPQLVVAVGIYAAGYLAMPRATAERQLISDLFSISRRRLALFTARG